MIRGVQPERCGDIRIFQKEFPKNYFLHLKLLFITEDHDWIARPVEEFKIQGDNFCAEVLAHGTTWGVNADDATELPKEQKTFNDNHAISVMPMNHTSLDIQKTNASRVPYEARIRKIGIPMKTNSKMTDLERSACGVVNDSTSNTQSPIADVSPVVQYERSGNLGGEIVFSNPEAGKPDGQDGVSVSFGFFVIGTTPPTEAECTKTVLFTKKHGKIVFEESRNEMALIAYARYINTRLVLGTVATKFGGIVS